MKKKITLSITFALSLFPMFMNQYGGCKGVQEISGIINLLNPIGILSVALFAAGVWVPLRHTIVNKILGAMGVIGMVVSEIYQFCTWYLPTITGEMNLQKSFELAYPEFYIGLAASLVMVITYFIMNKSGKK